MRCSAALILAVFLVSCTENPFSRPAEIASRQSVSGRVINAATGLPLTAYVWFEAGRAGQLTDSQGKFILTLPDRSRQPAGGLTGVFSLYVLAGNFQPHVLRIVVRNGEFVYSQPPVDELGNIEPNIALEQLFEVHTSLTPDVFTREYEGPWQVDISVRASGDSIAIQTIESDPWQPGALIIQRIDTTGISPTLLSLGKSRPVTRTVDAGGRTWSGRKNILPGEFPVGEYRVVPLFWIRPEVPDAIFETLGVDFDSLNTNYLKIPFVRTGGQFEVRNPK